MYKFVRIFLGFCFVFCLAQAAFSATYTVTKIADTNDGMCNADCSLREAIAAANLTTDNDAIEFSTTLFSTNRIGMEFFVRHNPHRNIMPPHHRQENRIETLR